MPDNNQLEPVIDDQLAERFAAQGLELIFADSAILLVNKPSGLLAVPGRSPSHHDCVALRVQSIMPEALIVHRLDMETSGLMLMALSKEAHRTLSIAFQERQVGKRYIAIVDGQPEPAYGQIDYPLIVDWPNRPRQMIDRNIGKASLTHYRVIDHDGESSRVELLPLTGRSHQLRVHMSALGHPILGDALYAPPAIRAKAARLLLHAESLSFRHPFEDRRLSFSSLPPF